MILHTSRLYVDLAQVTHATRNGNVARVWVAGQVIDSNHPDDTAALWEGLEKYRNRKMGVKKPEPVQ